MPAPGYDIGRTNLEQVREFFASHLCATNRECAAALGLSVFAVGRHVRTIRSEWCSYDQSPTDPHHGGKLGWNANP